ncbi:M48 family metallopeptidase [Treponema sp.]|uniref:M48 family metallopeptidase n=1 Tax=Treponema sp. TaxID=166 RepID=UPI0025D2BA92|nr:SprT family zinc-dependent metalloprotease [Treponema sp.]MCR5218402.1 M48 family metallopeptidase [Treponema sp.]
MSISVDDDGIVIVKIPLVCPESHALNFLEEKKDWILKHLIKNRKQAQLADQMGYLSEEDIKKLKRQARKIIPPRVEFYAKKAGITYNRIFIRLQKSRWGSCSAEGNLNFNCLLALMPPQVLDSVVVHELCHRHHMDHSKAFYQEVLSIYPEYKKWNKWLKENGGAFFKRIQG